MLKKSLYGAFGIAALMSASAFAGVETREVALEELHAQCMRDRTHEQVHEGKVNYRCQETQVFWKQTKQTRDLLNSSSLQVKAHIKTDQATSWIDVAPKPAPGQTAVCYDYVQYKATLGHFEPGTCDLAGAILAKGGEAAYCSYKLTEAKKDCAAEMAAVQAGTLVASEATACRIEATGEVFNTCDPVKGPAPTQAPESTTTESSSSTSSSSDDGSSSSDSKTSVDVSTNSSSSAQEVKVKLNTADSFGAAVKPVEYKSGLLKHKALQLLEEPSAGSPLARLGMHKGDLLIKVANIRIKEVKDLEQAVAKMSGRKDFYVEAYRSNISTFQTNKIANF